MFIALNKRSSQSKINIMKSIFKKLALVATGVLIGSAGFAQSTDSNANYVKPFSGDDAFRTWSIGIGGGMLSSYTLFGGKQDFKTIKPQLGYSGYVKKQIWHSFGIEADFLGGQIAGSGSPTNSTVQPYASYSTHVGWSAALMGNVTLGNINWFHTKSSIQPYATFGGGYMSFAPRVYSGTGARLPLLINSPATTFQEFFIPVGLGLKFDVAPGVNLDLGYQVNFVNSDYIDGYAYGAGYDKFSYAHIGLEFALGSKSKPQLATHNPVASMRTEYLMDEQRLQAQVDAQKAQNDQLRSDLDATRNDLNKTNANLARFTADSDGDGVPDLYDKCPGTAAGTKVDGSGCPLPINKPDVKVYVTEEDKKVVKDAIKNLEFDFGKSTLRPTSFPSLDRVAQLLIDKNFSLKLAGHTDNVGSNDANLKLSKDRAESIKTYLVSKGANASRIEATGYGETQPIATNKTAAGRQQNRRVEFTLF